LHKRKPKLQQGRVTIYFYVGLWRGTGVARNFDWGEGGKMEKFCDVFLWRFSVA